MKLKQILLIITSFLSIGLFAQTKIIAHKSHSGKPNTFNINNSSDNFGLPSSYIDTIFKISDTCVLEVGWNGYERKRNIVCHHPCCNNPKISLDSLKKIYPNIILIGFEPGKKTGSKKSVAILIQPKDTNNQNRIFQLIVAVGLLSLLLYFFRSPKPKSTTF